MIVVHKVTIGDGKTDPIRQGEHKRIYVGCAQTDIRYREMLVNFRQRWEFYSRHTFDFITSNKSGLKPDVWKKRIGKTIRDSDGVMMIVSAHTNKDEAALWEIDCAIYHDVPIVGVDVGQNPDNDIPEKLEGKMTKYGWEWFAWFIDGL